jgi:hypothetical protein
MKNSTPKKLALEEIKLEPRLMVRAELNQDTVADYSTAMEEGAKFPPVDVFAIDGGYYLADGWHRYHAAQKLEFKDIDVTVHKGDAKDAVGFALKANQSHGLRRTNADKRKAVGIALQLWPDLSSRGIADLCGVHHDLVGEVRQVADSATSKVKGKDGKAYPVSQPRPPRQATPADAAREDGRKDAAESSDADHDHKAEWTAAQDWTAKAQEIAEAVKALEGMDRGSLSAELVVKTCRQLADRLNNLAMGVEQ